ncbi:hypothetical protein [Oceanivirga salmonicida]|uniref:hypothetical protein n=1 Tax=Oceanivirga salmonicida TaxID=1769291 RepID=UPI0012E2702D|nr:hypothetical protein [Oceanivirga salmonicida]
MKKIITVISILITATTTMSMTSIRTLKGIKSVRGNVTYTNNSITKNIPIHTVFLGLEGEYLLPVYENYNKTKFLLGVGGDIKLGFSGYKEDNLKKILIEGYLGPYVTGQFGYQVNRDFLLRGGLKVGVGLDTHSVWSKPGALNAKFAPTVGVPITLIGGLDYNKFSLNLEIGGKYLAKKGEIGILNKHKFVFTTGISLGYIFK